MKKTITSLALIASAANAYALPMPPRPGQPLPPPPVERTICLSQYNTASDGSPFVGGCDESERNQMFGEELLENGCAKHQVAIKTTSLKIRSCPSAAQL